MISAGLAWLESLESIVILVMRTCLSAPGALVQRPGEVIRQFEQVAVRSLPMMVGAGLSVGLVAWIQTHRLLAAHGAQASLPSFLAVAVLVEVGPILAGLLTAARMGAGLAAELGSMVLNDEIDAAIVLGADPVPMLVAPRTIACALAVPLLTVIVDASALLGSLAAELAAGKSTFLLFWSKALVFLRLSDVIPATLKTAVFGLVIGLIACYTGLNAERSSEAVGGAAIRGVVRAIFGVFTANLVMVPCIQILSEALE